MKTKIKRINQFGGSAGQGLKHNFIAIIALGLLVLLSALNARAQQITGSIAGTVKDGQGAVVPGAAVKATNVDTGFSRVATTANDGAYRIEYLPVGKYDVEVEMAGFQKFVQQNIVLALDQTQALNVTLAVGASSETVTVSAAPALVETTTATLGRTVQPAEIIGLPLVNRNAYAELSLTPGVQSNSASGATNASNSNPNGTPNYQIGVPSTQVIVNGGIDGGVPMVSFLPRWRKQHDRHPQLWEPAAQPRRAGGVSRRNQQLLRPIWPHVQRRGLGRHVFRHQSVSWLAVRICAQHCFERDRRGMQP